LGHLYIVEFKSLFRSLSTAVTTPTWLRKVAPSITMGGLQAVFTLTTMPEGFNLQTRTKMFVSGLCDQDWAHVNSDFYLHFWLFSERSEATASKHMSCISYSSRYQVVTIRNNTFCFKKLCFSIILMIVITIACSNSSQLS
jgi:hypothetical protein